MSFRWKTILGIALIELVFLSILVWQASTYLHDSGVEALQERANDTVQLASTVLLDALIASDLASLEEQVRELGALTGVSYARVQGIGRTLAETGPNAGGIGPPDVSIEDVDDGIYDVTHTFDIAGQTLGALHIGFSVRELRQIWAEAQQRLFLIAFIELVLVAVCSWFLASYLTRRVLALQHASNDLQQGKPFQALSDHGNDEVSKTIQAFNSMSATLTRQKNELTETNEQLLGANETLKKREAEFSALLEAAPDAIAMLNNDRQIAFVNQAFEQLFGRSRDGLRNKPLIELLRDKTASLAGANDPDLDERNNWQPLTFDDGANGQRFCELHVASFESGAEGRLLVIIRDRTEEHRLVQAAKISEQLKANLVDSSLDALVTIDREGRVTDFSPSAETIFGWRRSEMIGQPMHEFIIPHESRAAHAKGMAHFLATGEGPLIGQRVETSALRRTGELFPVELALTAITVEGQLFVTASIRDISERKQKEQELIQSKAEAEQASMAKSRFLSYMSHEIRSPLNAVLGSLSLMSDNDSVSQSGKRYLQLAKSSGDSLLQVVNEVLDFSKIEAGQMEFHRVQFELRSLFDGVINAMTAQRGKTGVRLGVEVDSALPAQVMADRDHLRQVLTILLDNACKFTDQGEVAVLARHQQSDGPGMDPALIIDVRDTGPGIPENLIDTIFSEFEQVDALRDTGFGGSGLGLAIARKLVEGMDGALSVDSQEGVGTTFTLTIPFGAPEVALEKAGSVDEGRAEPDHAPESTCPAKAAAEDRVIAQTEQGAGHLLLVDDVEANLIIGSEMLRARGFAVDLARDGEEACSCADEKPYTAILMDMRMPRMNGMDAALQIRAGGGPNARTPIIALTANAEKSEIERCFKAGMNDFVSKPFNIVKLVQSIEQCLLVTEENDMVTAEEQVEQFDLLSDEVLDQLVADTSRETLPMMISVFINEMKKRVQSIDNAVAAADEAEIREQAHALKSCAGTFGGLRLQDVSRQLEDLASEAKSIEDSETIQAVRKVAEDTLIAYSEYHERLEQPTH